MKIKTWFLLIIAVTVSSILLVQTCFYFIFLNWNQRTTEMLVEATANQSASQIVKVYDSIEDVAFQISTNLLLQEYLYQKNDRQRVSNVELVVNAMSSVIFANKNIKYVAIVDQQNVLLNAYQDTELSTELAILENVVDDIPTTPWNNSFVNTYQYENQYCFAYVNRIFSTEVGVGADKLYSIVLLFEIEGFESYVAPMLNQNKFSLTVLDYENKILASDKPEEFGQVFETKLCAKDFWLQTVKLEKPEWQLVFSIPKVNFLGNDKQFVFFMLLVVVLNILVLLFMIFILIKNISESISDIDKEIGIICSGKWNHRIHYKHKNEIGSIVQNFNTLLDEYDEMNQQNRQMAEEIHQSKFLQLQAQIDHLQEKISPHFLYNSMEHIKGVALEHNVPEIADITCVLSQIFRYNLNDSKSATVEDELSYALAYFNVINARKKYPIRIKIGLSPKIMEKQIIKMIFQPILENILKHAALGKDGLVEFSGAVKENDFTEIMIRDNGRGIGEDKLKALQTLLCDSITGLLDNEREQHLGLLNIHTRLRLYYGPGCGISVCNRHNGGTEVVITIKH